jgi:DNA mismatch repair protein MutL
MEDPFFSPSPSTATLARPSHAENWEAEITSPEIRRVDNVPMDETSSHSIDGSKRHLGFQIHNRYLVTEDETGMVIVDQHALHERILYEQIKNKVLSKSLDVQNLLVPETITLAASEMALALEYQQILADIGLTIEPFGGDTLLISSYPAILQGISPGEVLRQVLEPMLSGGKKPDVRNLLDELMNMIACKAAVKAGDRLTPDEISSLLEQREMYQDTHHCPHGRPTALFFSRDQLDKMFKRI